MGDSCMRLLGKAPHIGAWAVRKLIDVNTYAGLFERLFLLTNRQPVGPQLFILGLPRSGTTLVYQYIVHRLEVAYFTNGVGRFWKAPCLITFLQHRLYGDYQSNFESHYGKNEGPVAPREAGAFWGRFFGLDDYVTYDELSDRQVKTLRNTIHRVQRLFGGAPFVNKNVKHLLRIDALSEAFPSCLFLIVERDITDVALSVLRGRSENLSDPRQWWSAKPPDYSKLKDLSLVEQVTHQLLSLQARMEKDLVHVPLNRLLRVRYESFCAEPEQLIDLLKQRFHLVETRNRTIDHFRCSRHRPRSAEERELIRLVIHETT